MEPGELVAVVGLTRVARSFPGELSGGELARAGLVVALANNPAVLLADEPTGELDFRRGSQDRGLLPPAIYQQLPYDGSYGDLSSAGAPARGSQQYSYTSWWNAMYQLAWVQNPHVRGNRDYAASAASLQFMIQATSESVRLYDVWGTMAAMMLNQWTNYYMPTIQQQLENSWENLSNYVNSWATGGQPQPFDIPNVTRISTISQALRYLWTALAPFQSTGH